MDDPQRDREAQRPALVTRVLLASIVALLFAGPRFASADFVDTVGGRTLEGEVPDVALHLTTATGSVEVPRSALRAIDRVPEGFRLTLTDGSSLIGTLDEDSLRLKTGLVFETIRTAELQHVEIGPTGFPPGALVAGFYPMDRYKGTAKIESCPITLEYDLSRFAHIPDRAIWTAPRAALVGCRHLAIRNLNVTLDRGKKSSSFLFESIVTVDADMHDKWADLRIEILRAGKPLVAIAKPRIDAEEGKAVPVRTKLTVATADLDAGLVGPEPFVARVVVGVTEN